MKKTILTIAIVLGITFGGVAQTRGLFNYGPDDENGNEANSFNRNGVLELPGTHGTNTDQSSSPLGTGALLLIGFGAAYALKKKREQ